MQIAGLQKMTLLDYPEKVAAAIFTQGCNLRCPFCHNSDIISFHNDNAISDKDVIEFMKTRVGLLDGICISGGEPLAQPDVLDFIKEIKSLGFLVKLDTNGTYPDRLHEIVSSGYVDYVAMDIKNSPKRYADTAGLPLNMSNINSSIVILNHCGVSHEFRTTVSPSFIDLDDIHKIAVWIKGCDKYYLQRFVMRDSVTAKEFIEPSEEFMKDCLTEAQKIIPTAEIR